MTTNNPKSESYIQVLNTQTEFELELSLEDKFLASEFSEGIASTAEVVERSEQKADAQNLPSVLVDEELLKELASIPDRFGFKIG